MTCTTGVVTLSPFILQEMLVGGLRNNLPWKGHEGAEVLKVVTNNSCIMQVALHALLHIYWVGPATLNGLPRINNPKWIIQYMVSHGHSCACSASACTACRFSCSPSKHASCVTWQPAGTWPSWVAGRRSPEKHGKMLVGWQKKMIDRMARSKS